MLLPCCSPSCCFWNRACPWEPLDSEDVSLSPSPFLGTAFPATTHSLCPPAVHLPPAGSEPKWITLWEEQVCPALRNRGLRRERNICSCLCPAALTCRVAGGGLEPAPSLVPCRLPCSVPHVSHPQGSPGGRLSVTFKHQSLLTPVSGPSWPPASPLLLQFVHTTAQKLLNLALLKPSWAPSTSGGTSLPPPLPTGVTFSLLPSGLQVSTTGCSAAP